MDRITWVDIYKGIAIILVVVGHSTGLFNSYIYQFHMAAFFFISGYTSKLKEKGPAQTIFTKFYTIYLPYISFFFIILAIVSSFDLLNIYNVFFKDSFPGILNSIKEFFNNRIYINILGATWFLVALLWIFIFQRILLFVCGEKTDICYAIISLLLFFKGYDTSGNFWHSVFIGQFYFALGYLSFENKWLHKLNFGWLIKLLILLLTCYFTYYFAWIWPNTVDYPSKRFGNALGNAMAACNGILLIYIVSIIIDSIPKFKVTSFFTIIGKNTLGIVFLHFLFFKISYFILFLFGVVDFSDISNLTPSSEIGENYWWLISAVSVYLSLIVWKIILKIQFLNFLMGYNRKILTQFFNCKGKMIISVDIFLKEKRLCLTKWLKNKTKILDRQDKSILFCCSLLTLFAIFPILIQGVICNDELQSYFWARIGFTQFSGHYLEAWFRQGRVLGAPLSILAMYSSFLSESMLISKSVSVAYLSVAVGLFAWLVARILKNKTIGLTVFFLFFLLLPINFEHVPPNAFVGFLSLPLILALLSLHLFLSCAINSHRFFVLPYCLLWFLAISVYEPFVSLILLYFLIAWKQGDPRQNDFFKIIYCCRYIIATTFFFLFFYIILRTLFPSNYEGNSLADFNLFKSAKILFHLLLSGIPGYYLFNSKYHYLFEIYTNSYQSMGSFVNASSQAALAAKVFPFNSGVLVNFRTVLTEPRILAIATLGIFIIWKILKCEKPMKTNLNKKLVFSILITPFFIATLFALPNSISKLYQDSVNSNDIIALPVTILIYGTMIFVFAILLWLIIERISNSFLRALIFSFVLILILAIQSMNGVFAQEQSRNFERYRILESVFDTAMIKQMNGKAIFAPDFYARQNLLAIHDGYWNKYIESKNLQINLGQKYSNQSFELRVLSSNQILLLGRTQIDLLSTNRLDGMSIYIINNETGTSTPYIISNGERDGVFIRYKIKMSKDIDISHIKTILG